PAVPPEGLSLDVHTEVRNDHQGHDHQGGDQDSGNDGRKVVQQFLKAQEIPGGFGRVGSEQRVGKLLERRVPEERQGHQYYGQNLENDPLPQDNVGVRHELRADVALDLGGGVPRDEDDAARLLHRV